MTQITLPSDPLRIAVLHLRSSEHTDRGRRFRPVVALVVNAGLEECFRRSLASELPPTRPQTEVGASVTPMNQGAELPKPCPRTSLADDAVFQSEWSGQRPGAALMGSTVPDLPPARSSANSQPISWATKSAARSFNASA